MKTAIACLALAAAAATPPIVAHGQSAYGQPGYDQPEYRSGGYSQYVPNGSPDSHYCAALIDRYYTYVASPYEESSYRRFTARVGAAVADCQQGRFAAGIPTLERALLDAKVKLPPRG